MILSIESAAETCSVAIHDHGVLLSSKLVTENRQTSSVFPLIIDEVLDKVKITKKDLKAVAYSAGPGSYTGLRIAASVVKGLCYALEIPVIAVPTLDILHEQVKKLDNYTEAISISMLDARRMEVYAAIWQGDNLLKQPHPLIITPEVFDDYQDRPIWLIGPGAAKCREVVIHPRVYMYDHLMPDARFMGEIAYLKLTESKFEDLVYFEPIYLKPYQTKPAKDLLKS